MSFHQNKVILITILTAILAANSNSQSHSPKVFVLLDQWIPDLQNEMFNVNSDPESRLTRTKRIGSLSIVNSLDVLRQRYLLELARKKELQDQRQIDANRRFLETVGKRSVRPYNSDTAKDISGRIRSGLEYSIEQGWLPDPVFRERTEE